MLVGRFLGLTGFAVGGIWGDRCEDGSFVEVSHGEAVRDPAQDGFSGGVKLWHR